MNSEDFKIESDISRAQTLPSSFYRSQTQFDRTREAIFAKSWHCIGLESDLPPSGAAQSFVLMPGYLDEPLLLLSNEEGQSGCYSNVCTHRGNLLVMEGGPCAQLRCRYHGRRFDLNGKMLSMPEFKEAKNFPAESDHLPKLPLKKLGNLLFTSLSANYSFEQWLQPVLDRLSWMPFEAFRHAPDYGQTYEVNGHWALYVDNYLEGFHIPFVHPGLSELLSYPDYTYECYEYANLQLGVAKEGEQAFDLPASSPDYGKQIAAYYYWLFPNIMLNFYPWGLSLNIVEPVSVDKTTVRFENFIWKEDIFEPAHIDRMHLTEIEDEAVVESVQKGINSRLYHRGRYSPKQEVAVHHFHRLIAQALKA
ncbi:MAG: aromatic ring-hydroxylating dioxygenase subunit alpha [Bacteroidota bacterium]